MATGRGCDDMEGQIDKGDTSINQLNANYFCALLQQFIYSNFFFFQESMSSHHYNANAISSSSE